MSLRSALIALPDDRDTKAAVREVVAYLDLHRGEQLVASRIERATGVMASRVEGVLAALSLAKVVDCDGDPRTSECVFAPDGMLDLEVRRFLRSAGVQGTGAQRRVERYRGTYGSGT